MDDDIPKAAGVDSKLVALALKLRAKILTNDFNLHKVAELQGIEVLNINQLANAMKPAVLPGETLQVQILREGKSQGQGVAYLDDGTMVVIENARRFIGREVEVAGHQRPADHRRAHDLQRNQERRRPGRLT